MNSIFEANFNDIFTDLDSAPASVQAEYGTWGNGYDACTQGEPCPSNASEEFQAGYGHCYAEGARMDAREQSLEEANNY